ncbi:hypothetical protein PMI08_01103 [Brevibacillus sp. CF112]|nr:hypothetical protein PMI08_01103 [Brevibacillus sp. CF112]
MRRSFADNCCRNLAGRLDHLGRRRFAHFFCFHTQGNSLIKVDIHDDFSVDLNNGGMKDV